MIYVALLNEHEAGVFDNLDDCLRGCEEHLDTVTLVKVDTFQRGGKLLMEKYTGDQLFRAGIYCLMDIKLNRRYSIKGC